MEFKQLLAIFGALAFMGTFVITVVMGAAYLAVVLLGEERLSRWTGALSGWVYGGWGLARKLLVVLAVLIAGYGATLVGASTFSHNYDLSPGQEKYFCEIDCHIAYAVMGVEKSKTIGTGPAEATAAGMFYTVNLRTRFDEHTISPTRGDGPLQPSPRLVTLVDDQGREFSVSDAGQQALENSLAGHWTSLVQPLRPGESYTTGLVFDVPAIAHGLKLLIASPSNPTWINRVIIGDEDSILHKKVYLQVGN
ncbi:MAG TPA: hypothetical protein VJR23_16805 [Candidatus Acidoferrales bacterium]|nr:hypothetical protein [Candidatus Acidoferrales bacterium]